MVCGQAEKRSINQIKQISTRQNIIICEKEVKKTSSQLSSNHKNNRINLCKSTVTPEEGKN